MPRKISIMFQHIPFHMRTLPVHFAPLCARFNVAAVLLARSCRRRRHSIYKRANCNANVLAVIRVSFARASPLSHILHSRCAQTNIAQRSRARTHTHRRRANTFASYSVTFALPSFSKPDGRDWPDSFAPPPDDQPNRIECARPTARTGPTPLRSPLGGRRTPLMLSVVFHFLSTALSRSLAVALSACTQCRLKDFSSCACSPKAKNLFAAPS